MKNIIHYLTICLVLVLSACQNKDIDIEPAKIAPLNQATITGHLEGDNYVLTWDNSNSNLNTVISIYSGNTLVATESVKGTSYVQKNIDTNIEYTYVLRLSDGTNQSNGVVWTYMRPGAAKVTGLSLSQVENAGKYDMQISWDENKTATSVELTATNNTRTIKEVLGASTNTYTVSNVSVDEEWSVEIIAVNGDGKSLPVNSTLRIGKTAVGFLSVYPTLDDLMANGDDDEICSWLWLNETYPTAQYIYFGNLTSVADLEIFRVLFWLRDLEGVDASAVFEYPSCVEDATPIITEWYTNGGNLLLWSHATAYIGKLGRIDTSLLTAANAIGTGFGGNNGDTWKMAVSLNPGSTFTRDHSSHPIYRGMATESNGRCKLIAFKGPGWTEDHNCLYFDIPTALTGLGNQDEQCYNKLTNEYGIYPLGTWDSQIDWVSQLNVWEAQKGNTEFKGTILCVGNGGCEFSMRNDDGTPDISAHPKNNIYQDNVLLLAKNSIEYLKTR